MKRTLLPANEVRSTFAVIILFFRFVLSLPECFDKAVGCHVVEPIGYRQAAPNSQPTVVWKRSPAEQ